MRFAPKTETEVSSGSVWPAGDYDFEVNDSEETQSKAGNDMVKLTLHVFNPEGQRRTVFDYLVSTDKAAYKIRHFAEAAGLLARYESGEMLAEEMIGRTGRCKIAVRKDASGQYPDQNSVADYLASKVAAAARVKTSARDLDDEIPF